MDVVVSNYFFWPDARAIVVESDFAEKMWLEVTPVNSCLGWIVRFKWGPLQRLLLIKSNQGFLIDFDGSCLQSTSTQFKEFYYEHELDVLFAMVKGPMAVWT